MTADHVHWFLDLFDELEITVWIDGGRGVDALLGECTRPHEDLDIIIPAADSAKLTEALFERGFSDVPTDDRCDRNFVMGHPSHGLIDFHVIQLTDDGGAVYGPGDVDWVISRSERRGEGSIRGRSVRCLTAEYQVRSHTGYTLKETDFADMNALHERFGVALLDEQRWRA
ncbi:nucleotidyltransferase domain-containing protein [Gemmatimonadota bacterium]